MKRRVFIYEFVLFSFFKNSNIKIAPFSIQILGLYNYSFFLGLNCRIFDIPNLTKLNLFIAKNPGLLARVFLFKVFGKLVLLFLEHLNHFITIIYGLINRIIKLIG